MSTKLGSAVIFACSCPVRVIATNLMQMLSDMQRRNQAESDQERYASKHPVNMALLEIGYQTRRRVRDENDNVNEL